MADVEEGYIKKNEDGTIDIMESAYIGPNNINKFKFEFDKPNDITNSLKKNNKLTLENVNETTKHRTAYAAGKCVYPNNTESALVILTNVILQYREGLEKSTATDYGKNYVCIGIPVAYISKIIKDAAANSSIKLKVRDKFKMQESHYWIDCSLENVPVDNFYMIDTEGNADNIKLQSSLKTVKKSFVATICTSVSATMTNDNLAAQLDLSGTFNITLKPTEVYLHRTSPLQGPKLDNTNRRKKERSNVTEKLGADPELIALLRGL